MQCATYIVTTVISHIWQFLNLPTATYYYCGHFGYSHYFITPYGVWNFSHTLKYMYLLYMYTGMNENLAVLLYMFDITTVYIIHSFPLYASDNK